MPKAEVMNHRGWQQPVSDRDAYRRAGGRRRYNFARQLRAEVRLREVVRRLREGYSYTEIAEALHVHRSTISRDVQKLLAAGVIDPARRL